MLELYIALNDYCNSEDVNLFVFKKMCDYYTYKYRKLSFEEQGELSQEIRKYYQEYEFNNEKR